MQREGHLPTEEIYDNSDLRHEMLLVKGHRVAPAGSNRPSVVRVVQLSFLLTVLQMPVPCNVQLFCDKTQLSGYSIASLVANECLVSCSKTRS